MKWLTVPMLYVFIAVALFQGNRAGWSHFTNFLALFVVPVGALFAMEFLYPTDPVTGMSFSNFFGRDLKYFIASRIGTLSATPLLIMLALAVGRHRVGLATNLPFWLAVPVCLLLRELVSYWLHRWSHEADGFMKRQLWRMHVAHHLPEQMYILTAPVINPVSALTMRCVTAIVAVYVLAPSASAATAAGAIVGFQGMLVHANVDLRLGWLNYIMAGPELHRYHHSADASEAKNYANALSLLDVIFGTFVYRPGCLPAKLGVYEPEKYPASDEFLQVALFPYRANSLRPQPLAKITGEAMNRSALSPELETH